MTSPLGRYASEGNDTLVTVRLLQAPLRIWQRATEHHDEIMRELSLLALSPPHRELPERLRELVDVLGNQYGAAGARPDVERDEAMATGLDRVDLTYEVPRSSAASAQRMRDLLDEAEEYCRAFLLTLAQPEEQAAFSRWYIDQFVQQCAGHPPSPWPGPWD
ncbi:MAG: ATP-binding region ATPase domain protein [Frankiales bacterium]|jgi:hypothetical protein|nr:ATP-binding region ATPase domain protein [Frankiales bacterium]